MSSIKVSNIREFLKDKKDDDLISLDSSTTYKHPLLSNLISDLYLNHSVIFLGN